MDIDPTALRIGEMREGYESFYAKAHHPAEPLGVWIRYTSLRSSTGTTSSLWCTLFTADGPVARKVTVARAPSSTAETWIAIDNATFSGEHLAGDALDATWDLRVDGAEPPLLHLPKAWMYRRAIPRTKPISPRPSASFTGSVAIGDRAIALEDWPGMIGHNWGAEHAERWIWLHAAGLEGRGASTWLDVVLGRIKLGPATTPWIANGVLSLDGVRHRIGGIERARATKVAERHDGASLTLPSTEGPLTVEVGAPRERFVGWRYAHPDGSEHHVANCSIADATITFGGEQLVARAAAAYELGAREPLEGIELQPFGEETEETRHEGRET